MTVDKSILVTGTGGEMVTIPSPSFLVEHEKGLVLFDAGFNPDAADDPESVYGPLAAAFQMHFPAERRLDRQIENLGFSMSDVRRVVLSHSHFDHTGGLRSLSEAEGYVGGKELKHATHPDTAVTGFYRQDDLAEARNIHWNELPVGYDHDLFGDGSCMILSLPGHTASGIGMKVQLPSQTMILAGDALHLRENLGRTIGMPFDSDSISKLDSIRKLQALATQPDTTVWISHDPQDWAQNRPEPSRATPGLGEEIS